MKIGIDIDEVIVELVKGYLKHYEEKYGIKRKIEEIITYRLEDHLEIPVEEVSKLFNEFYNSKLFDNLTLVDGAVEAINKLNKKHELFFITARPMHIKDKTSIFLKKVFPKNQYHLFFSGDAHKGNQTKAEICQELKINIMIEDHADYALDCAIVGIKVFLLEKPWNKNSIDHKNITKVKTWEGILKKIK